MMLLHKKIILLIGAITILFAHIIGMTSPAMAGDGVDQLGVLLQSLGIQPSQDSRDTEQYLSDVLQAFRKTLASDDKETKDALRQWEDYLVSATHYTNTDHIRAINRQLSDYYQVIAELGQIIENAKSKSKNEYSPSWVDDLVTRFGKEAVRKNRDVILESFKAIVYSDEAYDHKLKDLIYIETMLHGSYQDYFGMFFSFYNEKLNTGSQKKMDARKKIAQNFLALLNQASFASMHNRDLLSKQLAEHKARQQNEEMYLLLKTHPLSHTFGTTRALEDLRIALEK